MMPRDADCVFCKLASAEIPAAVVFQNESILAFLDIGPLAEGHLLVIPKEHYGRLIDLPPEACAAIAVALPRLARALLDVTGASGFNLLANDGHEAGQVVEHVHFHLIPRKPADGLGYRWHPREYPPGRSTEITDAYRTALAKAIE